MRIFTIILTLLIFIASSNMGAAMRSLHVFADGPSSTCCATKVIHEDDEETPCHEDESEENSCCQDNCPCNCCIHIVYYKSIETKLIAEVPFFVLTHNWKFNYFQEYNDSVFHPPLA